jgi:hypothetical protein
MTDGNSLINLGKPANTLIEKVSDAIGVLYEPNRIINNARAEANALKIMAEARIEVTELEYRTFQRLAREESRKQENIESIIGYSLSALTEASRPYDIEDDWLVNFFDKSKLISDHEMQKAWAKILAGEAGNPGSFSKKTVNLMSDLEKRDAILFIKLCSFIVYLSGEKIPMIFDSSAEIYNSVDLNFVNLTQLSNMGLINYLPIAGFVRKDYKTNTFANYGTTKFQIDFNEENKNREIRTGEVLLTSVGKEIASIISPELVEGFDDYLFQELRKQKLTVIRE